MALFGDTPVKGNRKTVVKDKGNEIKMSVVNTDTLFEAYDKYLLLIKNNDHNTTRVNTE